MVLNDIPNHDNFCLYNNIEDLREWCVNINYLDSFLGRKKMYVEMITDIKAQSNQTSRKLVKINRFQK